jgi:NAD(P)-dependent dehydrogenase (short-subunit alcohol dehydrogenase family)
MPIIGTGASHGVSARLKPVVTGGTLSSDSTYFYRTFTGNGSLSLSGPSLTADVLMIAGGGGAIVNTASQWGLHPAPNCIGYNVTKAAVASFSQNLARDYAPHNVRVNAVCPGEIHTPMLEAGAKRSGRTIADLDALVPFGRVGRPDEVAALVAFLASEEAAFMCGSLVEITGAQPVA